MTNHLQTTYKKVYNDYIVSVCRRIFQDDVKEEHYRITNEIIKGIANDDVLTLSGDDIRIFKTVLGDMNNWNIDPIGLYKKTVETVSDFPEYQNVIIDALKSLQTQGCSNPFLWGERYRSQGWTNPFLRGQYNHCSQQPIDPHFGQNINPGPVETSIEEDIPLDRTASEIDIPKDQEDKETIKECVDLISDKILSDFLITNNIKYQLVEGMEIRCNERKHRYYVTREITTNAHFLKYTENPEIDMENDTVLFTDSNPDMVKEVFDKLIWKLGDYKQLALYSIV